MESIKVGKENIIRMEVTEDKLASRVGSGTLDVLATPMVVALMENASSKLIQPYLADGITTVGVKIDIEHISPTVQGVIVEAKSRLERIEGRKHIFTVEAYDNVGLIAKGTHERVSVKAESFLKKAKEKK